MVATSVDARCANSGATHDAKRFAPAWVVVGVMGAAALLIAGCGGGGGGGGSSSSAAYCKAFQKDWPTFAAASQKELAADMDMHDPFADASAVSQQLVADHAIYESAASLASALARSAPTKLKNDVTTDTENPKQHLLDLATTLTSIAKGDTKHLSAGFTDQFDPGGTGCNFTLTLIGGPDGTVAKDFWP